MPNVQSNPVATGISGILCLVLVGLMVLFGLRQPPVPPTPPVQPPATQPTDPPPAPNPLPPPDQPPVPDQPPPDRPDPTVPIGGTPNPPPALPPDQPPSTQPTPQAALWQAINDYRTSQGVGVLVHSADCDKAAQGWAEWMAQHNKMSHTDDQGGSVVDRLKGSSDTFWAIGENIAAGQRSVTTVMQAWKDSPPHNRNMLNSVFTACGTGVSVATDGTPYWCQVFVETRGNSIRRLSPPRPPYDLYVPPGLSSQLGAQ